jgi:hypothetical protein
MKHRHDILFSNRTLVSMSPLPVDGNAAERRGKRRRFATPTMRFGKSQIMLRFFLSPCVLSVLPTAQGAGFGTKIGARNLEQREVVLGGLASR